MADKGNSGARTERGEAAEVFRQFSWNLAGVLAARSFASPPARKPRAGKPGARR